MTDIAATAENKTYTVPNTIKGILAMVLCVMFYSSMDGIVKWLSHDFVFIQVIFFRCLFGLIPITGYVLATGGFGQLRTTRLKAHLARSIIAWGVTIFFILAITYISLADAYAIEFSAPILMTVMSIFILKEKVGAKRWAAIICGFVGLLIIVRPGVNAFAMGTYFAVISSTFFALYAIMTKRHSSTESPISMVFYQYVFGLIGFGIALFFVWTPPSGEQLLMLAAIGFLGAIAQYCFARAFTDAPVSVVAPFEYTAILWGTLIDFIIWGDVPNKWMVIGAAIVVASGTYITVREKHLAAEEQKLKAA